MLIRIPDGPWTDDTRRKIEQGFRQIGRSGAVGSFTGSASLTPLDGTAAVDASGGAVTISLPPAATAIGRIYTVKKVDATANAVTIDPDGAETIDGAATKAITTQWASLTVQSDGTGWLIL